MLEAYFKLTKSGIVLFVLLAGLIGYGLSFPLGQSMELWHPILLLVGLYFISSGSFAWNQAQEVEADLKMPRTKDRPIPSGFFNRQQVFLLGSLYCFVGAGALYLVSPLAALLGVISVFLYNIPYTLHWKKKWAFGAVPGAIPGALPVVIGYAANKSNILSTECVYLFLIMFLWQMPHFWSLAIHYREDYAKGGFPVLPVRVGNEKTLYHIGLYTFPYVGLALISPWLLKAHIVYILLVVPLAFKVLYEFFKYYKTGAEKGWLSFFLWVNFSMLVFVGAPVLDKWLYYF